MSIAIYGAGAIGALLGAKLSLAGEDVTLIARGAHLRAMQSHGLRISGPDGDIQVHLKATDDPVKLDPVDFLFLTVKAHSLTAIAPQIGPLVGPETTVVSAQNGIPWWYFKSHGGTWEGTHIESVDPGGIISEAIDPERIIGCVVYPTATIVEPGIIEHTEGNRFTIGELDGASSQRCRQLSASLIKAGFKAPIRSNIRHEIWAKLLGNVAFNPLSVLTRSTMHEIASDPSISNIARAIMSEANSVARALGMDVAISIEQRFAGAAHVGNHKTSMLQDLESGRPLELESVVGAVVELGSKLGISLPHTSTVYACVRLLAAQIESHTQFAA